MARDIFILISNLDRLIKKRIRLNITKIIYFLSYYFILTNKIILLGWTTNN
jgi:hypothetical protein